jgi:hypothetical protein
LEGLALFGLLGLLAYLYAIAQLDGKSTVNRRGSVAGKEIAVETPAKS